MQSGSTIYINGKQATWGPAVEAPYLYQQIRTRGHSALRVAEHCRILDAASQRLFEREFKADVRQIEECIASLLARDHYSKELSHIVELRLYAEGEYALFALETSLYADFELRALRPRAMVFSDDNPLYDLPTSAARATTELLRKYAERYGCSAVVRTDRNGIVRGIDGVAAMAVIDREIVVSQGAESVEKSATIERLRKVRRERITVRDISIDELRRADEIFYADVRGITSIAELEGEVLSDFVANAIGGCTTTDDDIEILA
ncbi:MAG: hypothetical protein IJ348_02830 [Alistipes sp.]|nr:hypothetical protein [Alistipes sp.]